MFLFFKILISIGTTWKYLFHINEYEFFLSMLRFKWFIYMFTYFNISREFLFKKRIQNI